MKISKFSLIRVFSENSSRAPPKSLKTPKINHLKISTDNKIWKLNWIKKYNPQVSKVINLFQVVSNNNSWNKKMMSQYTHKLMNNKKSEKSR